MIRKSLVSLMLLGMIALFGAGCASTSGETKVKCPQCGAIFTVDERLPEMQQKGTSGVKW
jgi:hypothetical protein